jgi:single-strand DNA-binding protein
MNSLMISGNLTRDPEIRFTPKGTSRCSFTVAVNVGKGEDRRGHFFDCVAWKTIGEEIAEKFKRGMYIEVNGMLTQSQWTDKDGKRRSKVEIVVFEARGRGEKTPDRHAPTPNDDDLPF